MVVDDVEEQHTRHNERMIDIRHRHLTYQVRCVNVRIILILSCMCMLDVDA